MSSNTVLTFEGLGDLEAVDRFYPGVTFTNAIAAIAGFSLNDAEFPPASGVTVALPGDGEITVAFDSLVTDFQGLFTHSDSLVLEFFLAGNPVGASTSVFTNNLAISGDDGTTPNEAVSFHRDLGFDSVRFTGGGLFTVDDISFDSSGQAVPEPSSSAVFVLCLAGVLFRGLCRSHRRFEKRGTHSHRYLLILATAVSLTPSAATAQIANPTITPASTPAGVAAAVKVSALIADPSVIPSSINLQQVDAQGRVMKVIGTLLDGGTSGDAVAGDRIFTLRFTVLEQNPAAFTYRVSAGQLGKLTRVFSSPLQFTVTGAVPTGTAITQPSNLTFTNISPITIVGTVGDPSATVQVNGIAATRAGNGFQASVPLQEGNNPITAVASNTNGTSSTASIQVTLDTTPPRVTIDSPAAEFTTTEAAISVSGIVNDLVVGTVNEQQATVTVNGASAKVANRRYVAENVQLAIGQNNIQVVSRDRTGNSSTASINVIRQAPGEKFIKLISGNNQTGPVGKPLPAALTAQVLNGSAPTPNVPVIFKVVENDGTLAPGNGTQQLITVNTDAQGQARATLTLGHRSGAGNNTVQAFAAGFDGVAVFTATGTPEAAAKILVDSGNSQFGPVGQALAFPFVAVVTDASNNRLGGVSVAFTVKQGGGNIGGQTTVQTTTDGDGRALCVLTLGLDAGQDNNSVAATFAGNTRAPATFIASAKTPGLAAQTSITGVVVDNSNNPIAGVTMRLFRANQGSNNNQPVQIGAPVPTDARGFFRIAPAPVGLFKLMADGATSAQSGKTYPTLEYDIVTIAGQENTVGTPIYLPALDPAATLCVSPTTGGSLTPAATPGFSLKIQPGAATFPGGSKTGCVSVSAVNPDKVPMAPAFGAQPRLVVTIQPAGAIFNPPAAITVPNMDGLTPNSKTELFSYDHDLSAFVSIGSATVNADGSVIASDPGVGVVKAGWHFGVPPPNSVWTLDPIKVKTGVDSAPCAIAPGPALAAAVGSNAAPTTGDICPPDATVTDVTEGPVLMKKDDVKGFHAIASGPGTYTWTTSDPTILKIKIGDPSQPQFASVTGLKPGTAEVVVRFTCACADANGVHHSDEHHIDVIVWAVESLQIAPTGAQTVRKLGAVSEVAVPVPISIKLTSPGAPADAKVSQLIRLSFTDPDDTATSPGIDPNGASGDDNAPIDSGGRRGEAMWEEVRNGPNTIFQEPNGQRATMLTNCNLNQVCNFQATFRSSAIAGDNYTLRVDEQDFDKRLNIILRASARTGTLSVRRQVRLTAFEMRDSLPIAELMSETRIAPAFSNDAYTDYLLDPTVKLTEPQSPVFLYEISPPNASERPTQNELNRFRSTNPATKAAAKAQIEAKAAAWVRRNNSRRDAAETLFVGNIAAILRPSVFSIFALSDKEDGETVSGQTNFYPDGITVPAGPPGSDGKPTLVDPDGDWAPIQVHFNPLARAIFIQSFAITPADQNSERLRNLLRQAVAQLTDHEPFEPTTTGLLAPGAPSGTLDDKNVLRMRGYKKLP